MASKSEWKVITYPKYDTTVIVDDLKYQTTIEEGAYEDIKILSTVAGSLGTESKRRYSNSLSGDEEITMSPTTDDKDRVTTTSTVYRSNEETTEIYTKILNLGSSETEIETTPSVRQDSRNAVYLSTSKLSNYEVPTSTISSLSVTGIHFCTLINVFKLKNMLWTHIFIHF